MNSENKNSNVYIAKKYIKTSFDDVLIFLPSAFTIDTIIFCISDRKYTWDIFLQEYYTGKG